MNTKGRHNFSARNIIVPSTGILRTDEVGIGYLTFLELYRYEITNLYMKLQGCTIAEANAVVQRGTNHFNSTLYSIMEYMVNDKKMRKHLYILISRNPCINYGSFIMMRIARVKRDIADKTLTIPSSVIKGMNADFDGDLININRIPTEYLIKKFAKNLNPKYNLHISRMDGLVNSDTMPIKDEIVDFYCFNTL